jgi:hypothetical protein
MKRAGGGASQCGKVGAATQCLPNIVTKRPGISSLGADQPEGSLGWFEVEQTKLENVDEPGFSFHGFAFAG